MAIPEWRIRVLYICVALLLLHELLWQWWWWRLDNTDTGITACSGNQILVSNDSKTVICQPCPVCNAGMTLSPPCGSILTLDTVIKCTFNLTKVPRGSKRKKSTRPELKKTHSLEPQNENFIAWSSLDVRDIYDTEELEDTNLSEIAEEELFISTISTKDFQEKSTTSPPKYSLANAMNRWKQRRKRTVPRPIDSSSLEAKSSLTSPLLAPKQVNKRSSNITAGPQNININCVLGGFLGTSLAWLLLGTALLWLLFRVIRTTYPKTWNKMRRGYNGTNGTERPEREVNELPYINGDLEYINATNSSYPVPTPDLKHLKLSELPPDLEYLLVKKLDVRCKGERQYGWQKVGAAFKIASDDLRYLKIEYKRDNGSPTSKLLSILGISKGKTVSDLVNVLKSPKVQLTDVASLVSGTRKQ